MDLLTQVLFRTSANLGFQSLLTHVLLLHTLLSSDCSMKLTFPFIWINYIRNVYKKIKQIIFFPRKKFFCVKWKQRRCAFLMQRKRFLSVQTQTWLLFLRVHQIRLQTEVLAQWQWGTRLTCSQSPARGPSGRVGSADGSRGVEEKPEVSWSPHHWVINVFLSCLYLSVILVTISW